MALRGLQKEVIRPLIGYIHYEAPEEEQNFATLLEMLNLMDVREDDEFKSGHIPGALSIPLSRIDTITIPKDKPLYVYCLRGTRSKRAAHALKRMGYANVKSIGGIATYTGSIER